MIDPDFKKEIITREMAIGTSAMRNQSKMSDLRNK